MAKTKQTRPKGKPIPVRFTREMLRDIAEVAANLQISTQEVIRKTTGIGIEYVRNMDSRSIPKLIVKHLDPPASCNSHISSELKTKNGGGGGAKSLSSVSPARRRRHPVTETIPTPHAQS